MIVRHHLKTTSPPADMDTETYGALWLRVPGSLTSTGPAGSGERAQRWVTMGLLLPSCLQVPDTSPSPERCPWAHRQAQLCCRTGVSALAPGTGGVMAEATPGLAQGPQSVQGQRAPSQRHWAGGAHA